MSFHKSFVALESRGDLYQTCIDSYCFNCPNSNFIEFHSDPALFFKHHIRNFFQPSSNRFIHDFPVYQLSNIDFIILTFSIFRSFISALLTNLINILRLKPPSTLFGVYIQDQAISYLLRNQPLYALFNPSRYFLLRLRFIILCLFSFSYMISLARYLKSRYNVSSCIVSHDIYHYSALVRKFASLSVSSVLPLKTPYSYTIPSNYEYAQYKLPPFLASLDQRISRITPSAYPLAQDYLRKRVSSGNKELFYLEHSAYLSGQNHPLISSLQDQNKSFYVLYLHSFTDDHHRYGYDEFDSIWEWTLFILDYFSHHSEKILFIKTHPNTTINSIHYVFREDCRGLARLQSIYTNKSFPNIHFLPSDFSNSYIISNDSSATIITHHGNIAIEALSMGLPTITSAMSPFSFLSFLPNLYSYMTRKDLISHLNNHRLNICPYDPIDNPDFLSFVSAYYLDDNLQKKKFYINIIADFVSVNTNLLDAYSEQFTESNLYKILFDFVSFLSRNRHPLYYNLLVYLAKRSDRANII